MVSGSGFRVSVFGFRCSIFRCRFSDFQPRICGFGVLQGYQAVCTGPGFGVLRGYFSCGFGVLRGYQAVDVHGPILPDPPTPLPCLLTCSVSGLDLGLRV